MRTVIVGGGLIGLATALALLERGEEVLLFEAREGVGLETSFANGGMLTPSLPEPWNGPGVFGHLLASIFNPRSAMKLRLRAIPSLLTWGVGFLRNSNARHYLAASIDNYQLARYSVDKTLEISRQLDLQYDLTERGTLCIYRHAGHMEERRQLCRHLREYGLEMRQLDVDEMLDLEPTLGPVRDRLIGGIWLPGDARGDAHLFCRELESLIIERGGEIRTGTSVARLVSERGRIIGVESSNELLAAERVVVAAGSFSPALLATVGPAVAVRPAKGYSITIDGSDLGQLPDVALEDEASHAVVAAFGKRLRVVGTAEFAGFDKSLTPACIDNLFDILANVLPELASEVDREQAEAWAGLRPMSNDGRPFIGPGAIEGLYINTGHGALGWTTAMGSAHVLADLMCGRTPATDHQPFAALR